MLTLFLICPLLVYKYQKLISYIGRKLQPALRYTPRPPGYITREQRHQHISEFLHFLRAIAVCITPHKPIQLLIVIIYHLIAHRTERIFLTYQVQTTTLFRLRLGLHFRLRLSKLLRHLFFFFLFFPAPIPHFKGLQY